jgi:hypothetical protein
VQAVRVEQTGGLHSKPEQCALRELDKEHPKFGLHMLQHIEVEDGCASFRPSVEEPEPAVVGLGGMLKDDLEPQR